MKKYIIPTLRNSDYSVLFRKFLFSVVCFIFCAVALLSSAPSNVYGKASKKIEVDIPTYYETCTFNVKCESAGSYELVLISPEKEETAFQKVDSQTFTCTLSKVDIGKWFIKLTDKNATSEDDITKVKISVTSSKTSQTDIVDNITVAKDINGLKVFLKNDSVVTTWTDDSCGNVNVKVTNLDTSEILGEEQVAESIKYYECELAPTVRNILVTVVPSVSANIEGAANSYTFRVNNHPEATVTYPNITATNEDAIVLDVELKQVYSIEAYDNNTNVLDIKDVDPGFYSLTLPVLDDGLNVYKVYIVDADGNMRSTDANIIKDTYAPELILDYEYNGMSTDQASFEISGIIKDFTNLTINKEDVEVATDGHFSYDCSLHMGDNDILIYAVDDAGNKIDYSMVITRVSEGEKTNAPKEQEETEQEKPEPTSSDTSSFPNPIIIVIGAGIILFFVLKKKKSSAVDDEEDEDEGDTDDDTNDEYDDDDDENEDDDDDEPLDETDEPAINDYEEEYDRIDDEPEIEDDEDEIKQISIVSDEFEED